MIALQFIPRGHIVLDPKRVVAVAIVSIKDDKGNIVDKGTAVYIGHKFGARMFLVRSTDGLNMDSNFVKFTDAENDPVWIAKAAVETLVSTPPQRSVLAPYTDIMVEGVQRPFTVSGSIEDASKAFGLDITFPVLEVVFDFPGMFDGPSSH